jgi:serine protease AprX
MSRTIRIPVIIFIMSWVVLASPLSIAKGNVESIVGNGMPLENNLKPLGVGDINANQMDAKRVFFETTRDTVHDSQGARYLWETDGKGVKDKEPQLARYLWEDDSPSSGIAPKLYLDVPLSNPTSPTMSKYLWDEDGVYEDQQLARYLWDEEGVYEDQQLARYLWDEESVYEDQQLARYLWDEEGVYEDQGLARYLWDEDQQMVRYLWGEDGQEVEQVARYLWDDDGAQPTQTELQLAKYLWDEEEANGVKASYIISGKDFGQVKETMQNMGIKPTHEFGIIRSVAANLTASEANSLRSAPGIQQVFEDGQVKTASVRSKGGKNKSKNKSKNEPLDTVFPSFIDADRVHKEGITGAGVGIAIIDSGLWGHKSLVRDTQKNSRVIAYYDAIENREISLDELETRKDWKRKLRDGNGHGTHIASVIANSSKTVDEFGKKTGGYNGIAPDANLIIVKAISEEGQGSYLDVIESIAYVIANKERLNIRVMNLSFGGVPMSHYWQDPINQAVMSAWQAGIVVVASAGNLGPEPQTVSVPGNVPYVVTVGAMTDNYTPADTSDDFLATFSSVGPTLEGFVEPEILAPGGHMVGIMHKKAQIALDHPEFHYQEKYFQMSGTSQAAAVASGVAALIIQAQPDLSPNDVKCRLMSSARAATGANGGLLYSVFQQGTGLINAYGAVHSYDSGCTGNSMDIALDLLQEEHYGGPAQLNDDGTYSLSTMSGHEWDASVESEDALAWSQDGLAAESLVWDMGYLWNESALQDNNGTWVQEDFAINGYNWNFDALVETSGFAWDLGVDWNHSIRWDVENQGLLWTYGDVQNQGLLWTYGGEVDNQGLLWTYSVLDAQGLLWTYGGIDTQGLLWTYSFVEDQGLLWTYSGEVDNQGLLWTYGSSVENQGLIWTYGGSVDEQGLLWTYSDIQNQGLIWDYSGDVDNQGLLWTYGDVENQGLLWTYGDVENQGLLWTYGDVENQGLLWTYGDVENQGLLWTYGDVENQGLLWTYGDVENQGLLWTYGNVENQGLLWTYGNVENQGLLWTYGNVENQGLLWTYGSVSNQKWVGQE